MITILFAILGALAGFACFRFIGCNSSACPLTSSPYLSVIAGGVLGYLIAGSFGGAANVYGAVQQLDAQKAFEMIQTNKQNERFIILDIRTPEEYAAGHLESSINLNFYDPDFEKKLQALTKTNTYLVYCRSGNRSGKALKIMDKLGFETIVHLKKGISDWLKAKLPVVQK